MDSSAFGSTLRRHRDGRGQLRIYVLSSLTKTVDCQILLDNGAKVSDETHLGQTPLHLAAVGGNPEVVKVDRPHLVRFFISLGLLQLLVEEDASLDREDTDGDTPLHNAAKDGEDEAAEASQI